MQARELRRLFFTELGIGLKVVWPILSLILAGMAGLGSIIALLEGWRVLDGIYFSFVTGLTIGYGDFVPKRTISRVLAIGIGLLGTLLIALFAAIAVRAMEGMTSRGGSDHE